MSALIAVPPAPASPAYSVVVADGWYPEVDCNQLRDALRIGEVITHARLAEAVRGAMLHVMDELHSWRALREAEGAASIDAVEADRVIDGQSRAAHLFQRAVRFTAAAELAELHRDISATNDGQARADTQVLSAADYRRLATHAIRDLLGTTRVAVELI